MLKIGINCAGDRELEPFLLHIDNCKISEKAMLKIYEGTINGIDIVTLFCGVCKVNAAIAIQILIDCYNVNSVINAGTCGGMVNNLDIFDTVISTENFEINCKKSSEIAKDVVLKLLKEMKLDYVV